MAKETKNKKKRKKGKSGTKQNQTDAKSSQCKIMRIAIENMSQPEGTAQKYQL